MVLFLLLRLLQFWEEYVLGLVTFHLRKAYYWNLPTSVMYKYKIPLACIERLLVSICLDSRKKSTVEQNNTSETQEGCISCYQDLLLPSSLPRCLDPSKFQSKPRSLKAVLKVNVFWTSPLKVLQNQGTRVSSILPGSPIICWLSKIWLGTGLIAA